MHKDTQKLNETYVLLSAYLRGKELQRVVCMVLSILLSTNRKGDSTLWSTMGLGSSS